MSNVDGKILIFTDLHLGLQNNNVLKLNIAIKVVKNIIAFIKKNDIKTILFLGDWHHSRVSTENNVLNASYKLMSILQQTTNVKLIVGNHDIYMKNSNDVNSLVIFKDLPNVEIIDKVQITMINNKKSLLVPWLGDVSNFNKKDFDLMFGHFDVSSKYLIQTYINSHQNSLKAIQNETNDLVGDFIDVLKDDGIIFSGHIHGHKEFLAKGRRFIFVGSPYQQNFGEIDNSCGFYVLNEDMSYEFHELTSIPRFIKIRMSDIVKDINSYDFSIIKDNIIQKIYDIEIDRATDSLISQKILDMKPYEEVLPEYAIETKSVVDDTSTTSESIQLLKKSKFEYMQNYVDKMDDNALSGDFSKKELIDILEKYYNMVI